ncbi:RHS repeat-associated core domain-containing protein [Rhodophyticola porphyridii]|uniref:RHS repeat-associated core domain-containing protein n=1 Tax=Rhodophyticola porphyridii TaxID=1852017 RepID=A0A3L9XYP2_9RHOB|nr:RHS repeat-associated core domain-containing protein [Rhodophyticola porphyridii]RMA41352.1 hypothetical protein D9R08_13540 [Rhodophyticola porphyridii]
MTGAVETCTYDSQNRLIGWTDGVSVISYAYDALDRRIGVTVDGVTESFVYDPWSPYSSIANDVLLDFEDGALVRRWLHGPEVDEPLAYERYAGTTAGGSGTALELFRNRLGSVILAVSVATGAVAAEYDYDSFGQRLLVQGTEEVCYGFTSREHDALTGLIHYRARAYDPLTGQFLQRDAVGFASGTLNLYGYVEGNPYNYLDPSGLTPSSSYAAHAGRTPAMAQGPVGIISRGLFSRLNSMFATQRSTTAPRALMSQATQQTAVSATWQQALRNFGASVDDLMRAANQPLRGGLTQAGRALTKHAGGQRGSGTFPPLRGNNTQISRDAADFVESILNNPLSRFSIQPNGSVVVRGPTGQGARFMRNGRLSGFLD